MFSESGLSLVYFTSDPLKGRTILRSGADAVLVDCENIGKTKRQEGFDTEINYNRPEQVGSMRRMNPFAHIMCRVNNDFGATTEKQIEIAISCGVDTIVLPMTESTDDIVKANAIINDRVNLIIMIESQTGLENFSSMIGQKFEAIYVGLNDLSISRGGRPLFEPLYDGTIKKLIAQSTVPVGVGGVTDPSMGGLVESSEIIKQYSQLDVKFSILRRSFEHAITKLPPAKVLSNIRNVYMENSAATNPEVLESGIVV